MLHLTKPHSANQSASTVISGIRNKTRVRPEFNSRRHTEKAGSSLNQGSHPRLNEERNHVDGFHKNGLRTCTCTRGLMSIILRKYLCKHTMSTNLTPFS